MTHIAHCMRHNAERSSVYIPEQASQSPVTNEPPRPQLEKSPSLLSLQQPAAPSRYQLWPSSAASKSPVGLMRPTLSAERLTALSMGRSPTSLSDTAASPDSVPFWQRGSSLARRRKISVPELGGTKSTMATVQETAIDSPTIPGRPPLRKATSETTFGHERSSSAPGTNWRVGPFGDAMVSCVTGPSYLQTLNQGTVTPSPGLDVPKTESSSTLLGKPLSPILSPGTPGNKPALKLETGPSALEGLELPPEVPPKSPSMDRKGSPGPKLNPKASRSQLMTPSSLASATPVSAIEARRSPNGPLPTPLSAAFSAASPNSAIERRASPRVERQDPMSSHNRNASETSVMDRGRPVRRGSKRQRSRTCSEANGEPAPDSWKLPTGMRAVDASARLNEADKQQLHKQAFDQAEKFEVLDKRDVAALSRELRALDERCDYLRKTYKSLRAGRQKLHSRMISYLKRGETVIFSRESLLKQEEALAELDVSIDEFIHKLEQAENRRLRLRQKLLEHVAAALVLNPSQSHAVDMAASTPPRSPVKAESPARAERRDVESIKIYADGHVLSLFSDIEQAIGKMCEQAC